MPPGKAPPLRDEDFDRFRDLVRLRSGLDIPDRRRADVERLVARTIAEAGLPDVAAMYRSLATRRADRGEAPALDAFVAGLTIGETHFFRNRPQFQALERRVLPELIERRRPARRLRIWSAGCASGEEPYSLAILLHRLIPDLAAWDVLILGTDVNRDALAKARRASYGGWSFREVPAGIQETYFNANGNRFELRPDIRAMVTFRQQNLADERSMSSRTRARDMDVILCRNVLMYFPAEVAGGVLARLDRALVPDGWLLLGPADPMAAPAFATVALDGAIVYRKAASDAAHAAGAQTGRDRRTASRARPDQGLARRPARARPRPPRTVRASRSSPLAPGPPADDALHEYKEAKLRAGRGELGEADRLLDVALARTPLLAPAHYLRGLVSQERGDLGEALSSFRSAIYADPAFVLAHVALGTLCVRLGRMHTAGRALDAATALLEPRDPGELVDEGDGLTVGRLAELVVLQRSGMLRPAG
jgi:chemotaxis protein methyltransferase CheR